MTISDIYDNVNWGGVPASATATVDPATGAITAINLVSGGSGYTLGSAARVTITDATGKGTAATATVDVLPSGAPAGGIRKFLDAVPSLVFAVPDTWTYPGSDYYWIEPAEYSVKMHTDLPPTKLRGYRQVNTTDPAASQLSYLGPVIVAQRDRPVRIKFTNSLPTGAAGDLFLPVDTTIMGAGMGPDGMNMYTQNRATVHLHGNNTVWISDGTPHQWTTPAGETTAYPKGVSVVNVPDMPDPGPGSMTFYYTNAQSARLMFYHDYAYGITRLNVYAGEAAGCLITDQVEQDLINGTNLSGVNPGLLKVLPDVGIPLVIQDRTFVDAPRILGQDPIWRWGTTPALGPNTGDLWYPHVYMTNQNPWDPSGMNPFGRWHCGPWFWPPPTNITYGPVANPYYGTAPWEPPMIPGVPDVSAASEAFVDTPVVNGMAYPYLVLEPKAYRFRILNAGDDRFLNLQLYVADPLNIVVTNGGSGYNPALPPAVTISGGGSTFTAATATVDPLTGAVSAITVTNPVGYTSAPTVTIGPPPAGGAQAYALASVNTEVKMVPAVATPGFPAGWTTGDLTGPFPWGSNTAVLEWKTLVGGALVSSGNVYPVSVGTVLGFSDPAGFDELVVRCTHPDSTDPNLQEIALDDLLVQLTPVPEPSTLLMLLGGLLAAGLVWRRVRA